MVWLGPLAPLANTVRLPLQIARPRLQKRDGNELARIGRERNWLVPATYLELREMDAADALRLPDYHRGATFWLALSLYWVDGFVGYVTVSPIIPFVSYPDERTAVLLRLRYG